MKHRRNNAAFIDAMRPAQQAAYCMGGMEAAMAVPTEQMDEGQLKHLEADGTSDYDTSGNPRPVPRAKASRTT